MNDVVPTENESRLIEAIRSLNPYERLEIMADAQGRPDSFLLTRSTKVMLILHANPTFVK